MYMYCINSTHILYRTACPLVVKSHTIQDEVISLLSPTKYTILNKNFGFNLHNFHLHDIFHEHNPSKK